MSGDTIRFLWGKMKKPPKRKTPDSYGGHSYGGIWIGKPSGSYGERLGNHQKRHNHKIPMGAIRFVWGKMSGDPIRFLWGKVWKSMVNHQIPIRDDEETTQKPSDTYWKLNGFQTMRAGFMRVSLDSRWFRSTRVGFAPSTGRQHRRQTAWKSSCSTQ